MDRITDSQLSGISGSGTSAYATSTLTNNAYVNGTGRIDVGGAADIIADAATKAVALVNKPFSAALAKVTVLLARAKSADNISAYIIATGGGAPCFFDNIDYMNKQGCCIYLQTTPEILFQRLKYARSNRPLLRDKTDSELMEFIKTNLSAREEKYKRSSIIFDTGELESYDAIEKAVERLYTIIEQK